MSGMIRVVIVIMVALILIIECFLGIKRGSKKMLIRMLSLIFLGFVSWGIVSFIAEPILTGIAVKIAGSSVQEPSLLNAVSVILEKSNLSGDGITILSGLSAGLLVALIKPVLFVIMLLILRLLSWPVFNIVMKKTEEKTNAKEDEVTGENTEDGPSWLVGTGVGLLCGIICSAVILMPFAMLNEYQQKAGEDGYLETLIGDEKYQYLDFYDTSLVHYVYVTVGIESLTRVLFNAIAAAKVDGKTYRAKDIMPELTSMTPEISELITSIKSTGIEKDYKTVFSISNDLYTEYMDASFMSSAEKAVLVRSLVSRISIQDTEYSSLVNAATLALTALTDEELLDEMPGMIDLMSFLSEEGLLMSFNKDLPQLDNSIADQAPADNGAVSSGTLRVKLSETSGQFADNLADKVYSMKIADKLVPELVTWILKMGFSSFGLEVSAADPVPDFSNTKEDFAELISRMINICIIIPENGNIKGLSEGALNKLKEDFDVIEASPLVSKGTGTVLKQWLEDSITAQ